MKKYSWDLKYLKNQKKELEEYIKSSNLNKKEKEKVNYDIENIESMLDNFSIRSYFNFPPYLFVSRNQLINHISEIVDTHLSDFQKATIDETSKYFYDYEAPVVSTSVLKTPLPFENQIDIITKNFSFNKILFEENNQILNHDSRRLHLFSKKRINDFSCFNNSGYISIHNKEDVKSFCCLCHELGHDHEFVLSNNRIDYDYFIKNKKKLFVYREVYSIFYELLSIYFLEKEKIINPKDAIVLYNNTFQCNTEDINKFILALIINEEKDMDLRELLCFKRMGILLQDIVLYYYSYLIAANLFEKFLEDKEKALYNLNYLIENITPDNEEKVINYIDANPNDLTKIIKHTSHFIQKRNN